MGEASPERFVSTHQLPYENYRFEGPDLCEDPQLSIYLEDGYYSQTMRQSSSSALIILTAMCVTFITQ